MIKMKCPFCKKELRQDYTGVMYCCNENCKKSADWYGSWVLWEELIRTTQQLKCVTEQFEYVKNFLTKLYVAGTITDEQLERVKQELDNE